MANFITKGFSFDGQNFRIKEGLLKGRQISAVEIQLVKVYYGARSKNPFLSIIFALGIIIGVVYLVSLSDWNLGIAAGELGGSSYYSVKGFIYLIGGLALILYVVYLFIYDVIPIHSMISLEMEGEKDNFELIELEKSKQLDSFISLLKETLQSGRLEVKIKS